MYLFTLAMFSSTIITPSQKEKTKAQRRQIMCYQPSSGRKGQNNLNQRVREQLGAQQKKSSLNDKSFTHACNNYSKVEYEDISKK